MEVNDMTAPDTAPSLNDLLTAVQLPALPQSAIRLMELAQDPENGPPEFAMPIEADPGLAGQVLRFVNSSYFGFAREISSVRQAITLVGVRTIKNFALWSAVFSLMPNPKSGPVDLKKLWQDSLHRGLFARTLGKHLRLQNQEDLFAAALLQDMAIPLLAKELPDQYVSLLAERDGGRQRLSDLERERFGWTHADAAGVIARTWSLPEEFALLIEAHPFLDRFLAESPADPGKLVVSLSSALPSMHDETWNEFERFESAYAKINGADPAVPEILAQIDRDFEDFAPVLKIAGSDRSLQETYNETTAVGA